MRTPSQGRNEEGRVGSREERRGGGKEKRVQSTDRRGDAGRRSQKKFLFLECLVIFHYVLLIAFIKSFVRLTCVTFLQSGILLASVRNLRVLKTCECLKLNPGLTVFWTTQVM